jgi:hypothetical protein
MVALVRSSVDKFLAGTTAVGVTTAFVDLWLIFVGPIGWIVGKIITAVAALLTIGSAAINSAFTETVYDDLLCIFYENMDADGQVSAAQFADILTAIDGLDSVVNATMDLFFNVWGEVGLSNAGASGSETGECNCGGCEISFGDYGQNGWLPEYPGESTGQYYADGVMHGTYYGSGRFQVSAHKDVTMDVGYLRIVYSADLSPVTGSQIGIYLDGSNRLVSTVVLMNNVVGQTLILYLDNTTITGGGTFTINMDMNNAPQGIPITGTFVINEIEICPDVP